MVGQRFCELLVERNGDGRFRLVTFCEEPRAAYDRVGLTQFFAHRNAEKLLLQRMDWYREHRVELYLRERAAAVDRRRRVVHSDKGKEIPYDKVVLATGSYPFVPPVPGREKRGVFVYRTIDDLERIIAYSKYARQAVVIGGGLLGLEAAKAMLDLGLQTHVIERSGWLMPRQLDANGGAMLQRLIERLGVHVHVGVTTEEIVGRGAVEGVRLGDGTTVSAELVIFSCGVRPRDELAREAGLEVSSRGGVVVNDQMQTSDPEIYAIGEVACHRGVVYGLVAPGYRMAEVAVRHLCGEAARFEGADLSTKLKLLGVDVASFGRIAGPATARRHGADAQGADADERAVDGGGPIRELVLNDPVEGVYRKLVVDVPGRRLLGGVLVGRADDYPTLLSLVRSDAPVERPWTELLVGPCGAGAAVSDELAGHDGLVCTCNSVRAHDVHAAVASGEVSDLESLKRCTRAGTGCGGCVPLLQSLLKRELEAQGRTVAAGLCEHFALTRQELFAVVKVKRLKTFAEVLRECGTGNGCEVCKPAVASILASLWNEHVLERQHAHLQDTNDRFLANIQRGGLYSVIPRIPGGEITPQKLQVIGRVAEKYGLYTKITGAQRIDLFGARLQDLPAIWEELIAAGFESGHAYGKALRTVKSCVGSTWCRYGVQDSVGFGIRLEQRYKGIRAPHKIKAAVSGCVRECAEAQSKDFGLVATEQGYNLYVCGNGGAQPRHGELLATDLDEETAIRYVDRFLMYYIQTADKLTRTARWLEQLEGGIEHLRAVVVEDKLGIAEELERQMQFLIDSYQCEWKAVLEDPDKRRWFRQFVNSDEDEPGIEMIVERGQRRPADWPRDSDFIPLEDLRVHTPAPAADARSDDSAPQPEDRKWVRVGTVDDFPLNGGGVFKYGDVQIAVYNFSDRGEWYATQNVCPHRRAFVLAHGILGDQAGEPKVACPLHKRTFSLRTGECLNGDEPAVQTFPVKVEGGAVFVCLPPQEDLACTLGTRCHRMLATTRPTRQGGVGE